MSPLCIDATLSHSLLCSAAITLAVRTLHEAQPQEQEQEQETPPWAPPASWTQLLDVSKQDTDEVASRILDVFLDDACLPREDLPKVCRPPEK